MRFIALGEVAKIDRTVASDEECNILPYVGLEHIEKDMGRFVAEFEGEPEALLATKFRFTPRHVLYGKLRPYLNKVALPSFDGVCTTEILPILPEESELDRIYLWAFLLTPGFVEWASSNVSGANLPRLSPRLLATYRIPLPPLPEQKRIAAILSKADRLRRLRRYARDLSDGYLGSVFLEMFGDPVTNPMGWDTTTLGKIASIQRGRFSPRPRNDPRYYGGDYPFIQTGDIAKSNGYLRHYTQTLNENGILVSRAFDVGTVVIAIVGATIGETAILGIRTYCPDSVIGIQVNPNTGTPEYIEYILRFWKPIFRAMAPETARANINLETLRPLAIPLPPLPLQQKFAQIVRKHERLRAQQQEAERQAEHLFGSLLHRAFQAEL